MALEGTLKDVPLSDIIQLLCLQKKTGILTVFREKELVTISFEKGMVVFADEFQRSEQERLGAVLLKTKLISPQQLIKAVEMQKQTLQKLGFILVNNGFINQEQLKKALQMQVRETVFKLFRWEDGQFKFSQEPVNFDQSLYMPITSDFLVMEGVRRIDEWPLIKKKITSLDLIFDRTETADEKIGDDTGDNIEEDLDNILSFVDEGGMDKSVKEESKGLKLSPSERIIFSLVDGRRSVQELVNEGRMGEFETSKALFSLLSLSLIKKVGEAAAEPEEAKGSGRAVWLKKLALAGAAVCLVVLVMLANPISVVRIWPGREMAAREVTRVGDSLRREKIKFALLCYVLEKKTYPSGLGELVQADFLDQGDIYDQSGNEFSYLREQNGYSLRLIGGWGKDAR